MLTLQFRLPDIASRWDLGTKTITSGSSSIAAFASNQIQMASDISSSTKTVWIGEEADPFAHQSQKSQTRQIYRDFVDFEGLKIFARSDTGAVSLEVIRTSTGSSPIYVAAEADLLSVSWRFEDVVKCIPAPVPNIDVCRIYLAHGGCRMREQVIHGVFMLWPGESLKFNHKGLEFFEVDELDIVVPNALTSSARATDEFLSIVGESIRHNLHKSKTPLLELSGGLDSSCVAFATCAERSEISSYAVIHEGAVGTQQRERRSELVKLLGFKDFEFPSYEHPPFASLFVEECTFTPLDDMYRLPCVYAVDHHPSRDVDLLIAGIGGDELTKENTFQRRDWEVPGIVCTSAVVASAGRADMFMRRGIWSVNPLSNPKVVDFCRALPKEIRKTRLLNILALARAGLGDGFLFPRYYEHYGQVVQREVSLLDFDALLGDSILGDFGILDVSKLMEKARKATLDGFSYKLITELYLFFKLEVVLRRYIS